MQTKPYLWSLLALGMLTSCATAPQKQTVSPVPIAPQSESVAEQVRKHTAAAELLYEQGHYEEALTELALALPMAPRDEAVRALYHEIQVAEIAARAQQVHEEQKISQKKASVEIESQQLLPFPYGRRELSTPGTDDTVTPPTPMELTLKKPVTLHYDGADLAAVLLKLGENYKINIIADPAALQGQQVTVHVENVPLGEVFEYLTRNLGIGFYMGENVIWMTTASSSEPPLPLETRIYHLRHGANFVADESAGGGGGAGGNLNLGGATSAIVGQTGGGGGGGLASLMQNAGRSQGAAGGKAAGARGNRAADNGAQTTLEQAIAKFVPQPIGSEYLFDRNSHVLISKNTRENNAAVEKMIQTLDTPNKQILIEARFIQISVDDLHELGVDFILDSPTTVTSTATGQPKTQLDLGNILSSAAFPNAGEGLNLNYRGVLTNPMFKAVLHALEKSKKATSISNPRITTVNNRAANIFVGEIFQYFSNYTPQSVQSGVSPTGVPLYTTQVLPTGSPTIVPLGITLDVTPSVGSTSENITLVLSPSISQFDHFEDFQTFGTGSGGTSGTTVAGGSGGTSGSVSTTTATANNVATIRLPIFTQSSVSSKAIVRSGETVVLGGLIKENISKEQSAPPILGKIPLIGRLFRHTNNANTRSNLLIFVTASLLSTEGRSVVPSPPTKP